MKYLILSLALFCLTSCKEDKKETVETPQETSHQEVEAINEHHDDALAHVYDNSWTEEINLNDGAKWEANAATNEGVEKMQNTLQNKTVKTLEDYHELAADLDEDKNAIIKNCTMKGASHDNLHVWLLPLIAKIDALSETHSTEDASKIKRHIEDNVNAYSDYFE